MKSYSNQRDDQIFAMKTLGEIEKRREQLKVLQWLDDAAERELRSDEVPPRCYREIRE